MSVKDELRRMLDERGVEYEAIDAEATRYSETRWAANGAEWAYVTIGDNDPFLQVKSPLIKGVTPEQAIDATLGSEREKALESKLEAESQHAREGWELAMANEKRIAELEHLWHVFENEVAAQSVEIADRDKRIAELEEIVEAVSDERNVLLRKLNDDERLAFIERDSLHKRIDELKQLVRDMHAWFVGGDEYCDTCELSARCDEDYGDDCGMRTVFEGHMAELGIEV